MKKKEMQNKEFNNSDILEQAAKKLAPIEQRQKRAEKYFNDKKKKEKLMELMEENIKKRINKEKKAQSSIDNKTLLQLEDFLKNITQIDYNLLVKLEKVNNFEKKHKEIQTENEEYSTIKDKINQLERENEKLHLKKQQHKKELEILKAENNQLKENNDKFIKENKLIQSNNIELVQQKSALEEEIITLKNQSKVDNQKIEKLLQDTLDYKTLKFKMEEQIKNSYEINEIEQKRKLDILEIRRQTIEIVPLLSIEHSITTFLDPLDVFNLSICNKMLYNGIKYNTDCQKAFYEQIINKQKLKISEIKNFNLKKEYNVNDNEIEKLIKE